MKFLGCLPEFVKFRFSFFYPMLKAYALILPFFAVLSGEEQGGAKEEKKTLKRVQAHLKIKDYHSACDEAQAAFQQNPQSPFLFEALIQALAKSGEERALWQLWELHSGSFPGIAVKREFLEGIAWCTIEKGAVSPSPLIRIAALLAALSGQDVKGMQILHANMSDSNSLIRAASVKLASNLKDAKLGDEALRLLREDKCWHVRMEAVQAIGKMQVHEGRQDLLDLISSDRSAAEEKAAAIEALVNMVEDAERKDVECFARSPRVGLRLLACEVIDVLDLARDIDLLFDLADDPHPQVRSAALKSLGSLAPLVERNKSDFRNAAAKHLNDRNTGVAITAAWLLIQYDPVAGRKGFLKLLHEEKREDRLLAAAALASSGIHGLPLLLEVFPDSSDPFMKMNLALGLIGHRTRTQEACDALYNGLNTIDERWMWSQGGHFKALLPGKIKHSELIPNLPETVNQLARLEVLNVLAIMKYDQAQQAIRAFLKEKTWGISGMASGLLLTEGDEASVELVKGLLFDRDLKVRVQAGLMLALWGEGSESVAILQDAYKEADRELKEKILEGLGKIGDPSSVPFLVDKIKEPFQTLRIQAAAALLQCVNH